MALGTIEKYKQGIRLSVCHKSKSKQSNEWSAISHR
jgi:hypothetical protein